MMILLIIRPLPYQRDPLSWLARLAVDGQNFCLPLSHADIFSAPRFRKRFRAEFGFALPQNHFTKKGWLRYMARAWFAGVDEMERKARTL